MYDINTLNPTAPAQHSVIEPTVRVRLDDLVQDDEFQIRPELDEPTVRRYADAMRAGKRFPPVTVATINGAPVLVDGWHRVRAACSVGLTEIEAVLVDAQPNEMRWLAAKANMAHGLPLGRNAMREVFRAYVNAGQHLASRGRVKSSREIAADLHGQRSHPTILRWMRQDFPDVAQQMLGEDASGDRSHSHDPLCPEQVMMQNTIEHLTAARKAMRGVTDPHRRGELIAEAERIVAEMKVIGPWTPVPEDPEPSF